MFAAFIAITGAALLGSAIADADPVNAAIGLVMVVAVLCALTQDRFQADE